MHHVNRALTKAILQPALILSGILLLGFSGVVSAAEDTTSTVSSAQQTFASPKDAAKALADAVKAKDLSAIEKIFGAGTEDIITSGDDVQDKARLQEFAKRVNQLTAVTTTSEETAEVIIGTEQWPFPIPLVKSDDGKWSFDTEAGREEILNRRIGENELTTIKVCKGYMLAQNKYFEMDPDGDGTKEFAQNIISDEGKKDGLYWPDDSGDPSPVGPFFAQANAEGYSSEGDGDGLRPYHGYIFKILTKQGPKAKGGEKNYIKDGKMTEGFALVAYPAEYDDSGIMTFMINQDGDVMQKDLGEDTLDEASKIDSYNPDDTWTRVP